MNQILSTENNNNQNNNKAPIDIRKIIIFFAIVIVAFGLIIAIVAVYNITRKNNEEQGDIEPKVTFEQVENSVRVTASYDKGISKIIYYWTENDKTENIEDGKTSIQKLIDIPAGENKLTVQIVDTSGKTTGYISELFKNEETSTTANTIIDISLIDDGKKLKISAKDQSGLQFLTYRVNEQPEIKIDADTTDNTAIEVTVDIASLEIDRGNNTITVVAVDINNNQTTESKPIKGQTKPVIEAVKNGNIVNCTISHDMGFEKIDFTINGQKFTYGPNYSGYNKDLTLVTFPIPLKEGENTIIIEAYSNEGTVEIYGGRTTYTP